MTEKEHQFTAQSYRSLAKGGVRFEYKTASYRETALNCIKGSSLWRSICKHDYLFDKQSFEVIANTATKRMENYIKSQDHVVWTKRLPKSGRLIISFDTRHRAAVALHHGITFQYEHQGRSCVERIKVKPYTSKARVFCRSCGSLSCKGCDNKKCYNCAQEFHGTNCTRESKCINCGGAHSLFKCPRYLNKQRIATTHKRSSYAEALRLKPRVAAWNKNVFVETRHQTLERPKRHVQVSSDIVERAHENSRSSRRTGNEFKAPEIPEQDDENKSSSNNSVVHDQHVGLVDSSVQVTTSNIEAIVTKVLNTPGVLNSYDYSKHGH